MKSLIAFMLSLVVLVSSPSEWAKDSVDLVLKNEYIDNRLSEDYQREITRGEFAYLGVRLYEVLTKKNTEMGDAYFIDTFEEYVLKAKYHKIVKGYPDDTYKPDKSITREELATLFVNALKASNVELNITETKKFSDENEIGKWAIESVYYAREYGIVKGIGNNTFGPSKKATVEQALVMFKRAIDAGTTILNPQIDSEENEKPPNVNNNNNNNANPSQNPATPSTDKDLNKPKAPVRTSKLLGKELYDFVYSTKEDKNQNISRLKGENILVHVFTQTQGNNLESVENIYSIAEEYKNIKVVFINIDDNSDERIKKLEAKENSNILFVKSKDTNFLNQYTIENYPSTFVIDKNFVLRNIIIGNSNQRVYRREFSVFYQ